MDYLDLAVHLEEHFDGEVMAEKFITKDNQVLVIVEWRSEDEQGHKYLSLDCAIGDTEEEACNMLDSFGKHDFNYPATGKGTIHGLLKVVEYIEDSIWWWEKKGMQYISIIAPDTKRARAYRRLERYGFVEVDRYVQSDGELWVEWIKPL